MISRTVRIQLVLFVALTVIGVSIAGARYAGIGAKLLGGTYTVRADFADAGGIFEGAEVDYRGVAVGRVGQLDPTATGVDVGLVLDKGTHVPRDSLAVVSNRSAIGEQFVDLQPRRADGPFLADGSRIARADTRTPVPTTKLLVDLDRLVDSVPKKDLVTVIDELGAAFQGTGPDLSRLVDSGNALIESADANLRQTVDLIDDGRTVLDSQRASGSAIKSFSADLADLSGTLVHADPDLRTVLDQGDATARQVQGLIDENSGDVPILLANLVTTGQIVRARLNGVRHILILYPYVVRGGYTVIAKDPATGHYTAHFGLQLSLTPPACRKGYEGTKKRPPENVSPTPANTKAKCTDPTTTMRGAENVPGPATPERSQQDPAAAAYNPASGEVQLPDGASARLGTLGGEQRAFGEDSWKWLLIGPLTQ